MASHSGSEASASSGESDEETVDNSLSDGIGEPPEGSNSTKCTVPRTRSNASTTGGKQRENSKIHSGPLTRSAKEQILTIRFVYF